MSVVHQRALQSVKKFRVSLLKGIPKPGKNAKLDAAAALERPNPFLTTRVQTNVKAARQESKRSKDDQEEVKPKFRTFKPRVSLRRQADLVKRAQLTNTLHLLPPSPKVATHMLRRQRVAASLSPALAARLSTEKTFVDPNIGLAERLRKLKLSVDKPGPQTQAVKDLEALRVRAERLRGDIEEFEIISLVDVQKDSIEMHGYLRKKQQLKALEAQIKAQSQHTVAPEVTIARLEAVFEKQKGAKPTVPAWKRPVKWVGEAPQKKATPGAELGIRLYAGRKRMFKGHLWERKREGIIRKRSILMRDMAARVRRYKEVSFAAFALFLLEAHSLFCSVLQKENTQPPQAFQILEGTQTSLLVLSYFIIHVYLQSLAGSLSILMWTRGSTTRNSILPSEDTKYYVKVYCTNRVTTRG